MSARPKRWTDAAIRKATALPKPRGAIARVLDHEAGTTLRSPQGPTLPEIDVILRYVVEYADIIDGPVPLSGGGGWLLIPLPLDMIDALAEFEAHLEDLEDGHDAEHGHDREGEHSDAEPSLGSLESTNQVGWAKSGTSDREKGATVFDGIPVFAETA